MKTKKWFCLLAVVCLTVTAACPALGQEMETMNETAFAAKVGEAFPAYRADELKDEPLTYERALAMLCAALGDGGGTPAENLAFAIANDLIPGIAWSGTARITPADAQAMIAAFAELAVQRQNEPQRMLSMATSATSGGAQMSGTSERVMQEDGFAWYGEIDYNGLNDESYGSRNENRFLNPADSPFSTFALDADTASYANIRRCLLGGYFPETGAIRIEEMLNYFDYDLPAGTAEEPVMVSTELNICPWNEEHRLAMVALSGYAPDKASLPGSNLVFLVDVSGSMEQANRLPLARKALKLLLSQLTAKDTVAIVTYAGSIGTLLEPTPADRKETIANAIDSMNAGGSTNGAGGIQAAYEKAREAFIEGGNNRVILLTDGDFNVGVQSAGGLQTLIESERDDGIYLSVLGFGMGNLKDYEMETLADYGNGNYAYIDTLKEAKKVLVDDMTATLYTIAEDVKLQVEFNPQTVAQYRLLGYENRLLETEDFTDDTVDAGEMGAGYQMIALYEIVPAVSGEPAAATATSRYQDTTLKDSDELLYVSVRYHLPESGDILQTGSALHARQTFEPMSGNLAFASSVAELGLLLLDSQYQGNASLTSIWERAMANSGEDAFGYRAEFVQLVSLAQLLEEP